MLGNAVFPFPMFLNENFPNSSLVTNIKMNFNGEILKEKLIHILKSHHEGLTIQELSKLTGAHRQTVRSYLQWLQGANIVYQRRIGAVSLNYLKKDWERLRK